MHPPRASHITFMVALVLLCIVSIAVLAMQRHSLSDISASYQQAFPLFPYDTNLQREMNALPLHLTRTPLKLALAASTVALIISPIVLAILVLTQVNGERNLPLHSAYRVRPAYLILPMLSLSAILALASLVTTFVTHAQSSTFSFAYWLSVGRIIATYDIGHFDLEAWACQMALQNVSQDDLNVFRATCKSTGSGRWMLVPFLALAVCSVGLGWWTCQGLKDCPVKGNRGDDWESEEHEIL